MQSLSICVLLVLASVNVFGEELSEAVRRPRQILPNVPTVCSSRCFPVQLPPGSNRIAFNCAHIFEPQFPVLMSLSQPTPTAKVRKIPPQIQGFQGCPIIIEIVTPQRPRRM